MINKIKQQVRGFTLVETLVAVLLLSVAIAGPLTVASRALNAALVAKDQIVAYYLAQDALEYIRFRRDSNCLAVGASTPCKDSAGQWLSGLNECTSGSCTIDTALNSLASCIHTSSSSCDKLYYSSSLKRYTHDINDTGTSYKRVITISDMVADQAALVTVSVYWRNNTLNERSVVLKDYLFNWQ